MGGRGSFVNVNSGNFAFKEGGQTYFAIGMIGDNIKVLERPGTSVKAPEYSHTENRIYAITQKGELKHIAFYNDKHELTKSIDFLHYHDGKKPHVHYDVYHNGQVTSPTSADYKVIDQVRDWLSSRKR